MTWLLVFLLVLAGVRLAGAHLSVLLCVLSEVIHLLASIINFLVKGLAEGDSKQGSKEFMCLVRSYFPSSVIRSKLLPLQCTFLLVIDFIYLFIIFCRLYIRLKNCLLKVLNLKQEVYYLDYFVQFHEWINLIVTPFNNRTNVAIMITELKYKQKMWPYH